MSQQQYLWMLALIAAWRQDGIGDLLGDGGDLGVACISAIAGTLQHHASRSANDLTARLFVLWLFLVAFYAKSRAKSPAIRSVTRKIDAPSFFAVVSLNPAWLRLFQPSPPAPPLCQTEHLPTAA